MLKSPIQVKEKFVYKYLKDLNNISKSVITHKDKIINTKLHITIQICVYKDLSDSLPYHLKFVTKCSSVLTR